MTKKSSNNFGCGTLIAGMMILGIIVVIITFILDIISNILVGIKTSLPLLLMIFVIWLIWKVWFYITHRKPLSYEQVRLLARANAQNYIKNKYKFKKELVTIDPIFKSNLNATGRWYEIEEPLEIFPAYIAALLEGKHHEWVIVAIEKNGIVCSMWVNKGEDNQSVSFKCDINDIIQKCHQVGGYTVMRLHNHPNSDPKHYTTLLASEQDKISAKSCAEYVCKEGINWYDFVCARGEFIQFYEQMSDEFEVQGSSTSDIIDKIGICPEMDYEFQKQYRKSCGSGRILKKKPVIVILLIVIAIFFHIVGKSSGNVMNVLENNAISITDVSEDVFYNPSETYIKGILKEIPGILEIEEATSTTDVNNLLDKECSSVIFFTYEKVDQNSFKDDKITPTAKGTDGGGCIEVFFNLEDAKSRISTLKMTKLLAGGSYRYGTVVIRTSCKLSSSEQKELETLILNHMAQNPPEGSSADGN